MCFGDIRKTRSLIFNRGILFDTGSLFIHSFWNLSPGFSPAWSPKSDFFLPIFLHSTQICVGQERSRLSYCCCVCKQSWSLGRTLVRIDALLPSMSMEKADERCRVRSLVSFSFGNEDRIKGLELLSGLKFHQSFLTRVLISYVTITKRLLQTLTRWLHYFLKIVKTETCSTWKRYGIKSPVTDLQCPHHPLFSL